jgi:hypothetical protein
MRAVAEPTGRVARNARHVDSRIRIDRLSRTSDNYVRADVNAMHTFRTYKELLLKFYECLWEIYF